MVEARLPSQSDNFLLASLLQQEFNLVKLEEAILAWSQQMCVMQNGGGKELPYVLQLHGLPTNLV